MNIQTAARQTHQVVMDSGAWSTHLEECSQPHIEWMLRQIISRVVIGDEAHRWLGWVQAIIVFAEIKSLEDVEKIISDSSLQEITENQNKKFMVGQRVILTGQGGEKEIGTVVVPENETCLGVWVYSPTKGYASDYALHNVQPLPNGQI